MWWVTVFLLCSLFVSFTASVIIFVSDVLIIKYYKHDFNSKEFIKFSLLSLVPILNLVVLGCAIYDICDIILNKSGAIKFIDKFITDLIRGE